MRLSIHTGEHRFTLRLPTRAVFGALPLYGYCRSQGHPISLGQARMLSKRLLALRRNCPHMPLMELESKDVYLLLRL